MDEGKTRPPMYAPMVSHMPTRLPWAVPADKVTSRGSYCGHDHNNALTNFLPGMVCVDDGDCNGLLGVADWWGVKGSHAEISCTVVAEELVGLTLEELNNYSNSKSSISGIRGRMPGGQQGGIVVASSGIAVAVLLFAVLF